MTYVADLFNRNPYYDDFDDTKKFLRVLFRPGYAVQARELTQLQTILQTQVARFADHIFEDGSIVYGGDITERELPYSVFTATSGPDDADPADLVGRVLFKTGLTSATDPQIRVVHVDRDGDNYFIFYESINGSSSVGLNEEWLTNDSLPTWVLQSTEDEAEQGTGTVVAVSAGIYYVDGFFVNSDAQTIAPYTGTELRDYSSPTSRIGLTVEREIIDSETDESLNDPAYGSYNYGAPGADRYKISLTLSFQNFVYDNSLDETSFSNDNFIEVIRFVSGVVVKRQRYPDYSVLEETLARRTYDESGSYTVRPFDISLSNNDPADENIKVGLGAGKAYVHGYEFETLSTEHVQVAKARETDRAFDVDMVGGIGRYVLVTNDFGAGFDSLNINSLLSSNTDQNTKVDLFESGTPIGSARVRMLVPEDGSTFRLYVYQISFDEGKSIADVDTIGIDGEDNSIFTLSEATPRFYDTSRNTLVFRQPIGDVVEGYRSASYSIQRSFPISSFTLSGGTYNATVSTQSPKIRFNGPSDGGSVPGAERDDNYLLVDNQGNIIDLSAEGIDIVTNNNAPAANATATIKFDDNPDGTGTKSWILYAVLEVSDSNEFNEPRIRRNKVKVISNPENPTVWTAEGNTGPFKATITKDLGKIIIPHSDGISLRQVTTEGGVDLTSIFTFHNGQTDNLYDFSYLRVKPEYTVEKILNDFAVDLEAEDVDLLVWMDYYYHTNESVLPGPIYSQSYPDDYEDIPTYISESSGDAIPLRNVIDFRPYMFCATANDLSTAEVRGTCIPYVYENVEAEYDYYLPRTDKIVLTRNRTFDVVEGISSIDAPAPPDSNDAMTLYTITVNPYTFTPNDVQIRYIDNKRFTMRDIGRLENRIDTLEYYTNLSLLEQETRNMFIDDGTGLNAFKNGILVDNFIGHGIGDVTNPDYKCAIDFEKGELRPSFNSMLVNLEETLRSNISDSTGNVYLLDYESALPNVLIDQPLASRTVSVNPFGFANWLGHMELTPESDIWYDDERSVQVRVNVEGVNDAWDVGTGFGTQWNDWETNWFGQQDLNRDSNTRIKRRPDSRETGIIQPERSGRAGITVKNVPDIILRRYGNRIINVSITPRMRSNTIQASCWGLKPNTRVYAFFDGLDVTADCNSGSDLYTDSNGAITVTLSVSSDNPFFSGERLFRITDSATNTLAETTTAAEAVFYAQGIMPSDSRSGVRPLRSRRVSVTKDRVENSIFNRSMGGNDPLAQTFRVDPVRNPNGIFLHSLDLYFATKDSRLPVTVQIRPTQNGYPHPSAILPHSEVTLDPDSVKTTADAESEADTIPSPARGETVTRFEFRTPVYLRPGEEYAIVVLSNSKEYTLYTARLGDIRLGSSSDRIAEQPEAGQLFMPQNGGTWESIYNEDLMFRLNSCQFASSGNITFRNLRVPGGSEAIASILRVIAQTFEVPGTSILFQIDISNELGNNFQTIVANENLEFSPGVSIDFDDTNPSLNLKITFTGDGKVSPMLDAERLAIIAVENIVNSSTDTDPNNVGYNGELDARALPDNDPNAPLARYITRRVRLEPGFEASDIRVYLTANMQAGTEVQVFAKILAPEDETPFDLAPYIQLNRVGTSYSENSKDYRTFEYKIEDPESSMPDGASVFAIKIVMHSDVTNKTLVPRIKDMRAVAIA